MENAIFWLVDDTIDIIDTIDTIDTMIL